MKSFILKTIKAVTCTAFWIIIWHFGAKLVNLEVILPSPITVFKRLFELMQTKEFYEICFYSVLRVGVGILFGFLLGALMGFLTSFVPLLNALFSPIIYAIKSIPVASFIILLMLWVDKDTLPAFITFLIVFPLAWANISSGINSAPLSLLEISSVYKFSFIKKVIHIYIPSLIPFFISTAKSALGLAFKAGIAAEVLAVPALAIGSSIYFSKNFFETTDLFAWTLVTLFLSVAFENIIGSLLSSLTKRYEYTREVSEI